MMLSVTQYLNSIRWVFPATFMFGTAPTFYVLWLGWRLATLAFPSRVYEAGDDFLYSMYQKLVLFFYEHYSGIDIILSGDIDKLTAQKENVILIMNHQCAVDWMIANVLAVRQGSIGHIRYILKDELRYIPMYGFYFRQHSCIYVKRGGKFKQDKAIRQLDDIAEKKTPYWMVVFPEGTRYSPEFKDKMIKSQQFAKDQGLDVLEETLTPRSKALSLCIERLQRQTDAVYDVTVAYSDTTDPRTGARQPAPGLIEMLKVGHKQIHLHVERIPMRDVPTTEEAIKPWLHNRFLLKDKLLKSFYSRDPATCGQLAKSSCRSALPLSQTLPALLFWLTFNVPLFGTAAGRYFYWRAAVFGIVSGWVWISVSF